MGGTSLHRCRSLSWRHERATFLHSQGVVHNRLGLQIFSRFLIRDPKGEPTHGETQILKKLSQEITSGISLFQAFQQLDRSHQQKITGMIGPKNLQRIFSISKNVDPEIFWSELLHFGISLRQEGELEKGAALFHFIVQSRVNIALPNSIQKSAQSELNAILGTGHIGRRLEFLLTRFPKEAMHPAPLIGMVAGGLAYRLTRFATMSRLVQVTRPALWTRGWGAKMLASAVGFAAEVPTFTIAAKTANDFFGGEEDWSTKALIKDSTQGAILLGALRLTGWGSRLAVERWAAGPRPFELFTRKTLPQAAMLTGIMGAHQVETFVGLGEVKDGATTLVDSLVTLFQFNVAGNLIHRFVGNRFRQWELDLDKEVERLTRLSSGSSRKSQKPSRVKNTVAGFAQRLFGLNQGPIWATVGAAPDAKGVPIELSFPDSKIPPPFQKSSSLGEGLPSETKKTDLRKEFLPKFPRQRTNEIAGGIYTEEIFDVVLNTRGVLPLFHARLFEAYSQAPNCGKIDQLKTALAIQKVFTYDALGTSSGSFDNALLQLFAQKALAQKWGWRRNRAMKDLFQAMEEGLSRNKMVALFQRHRLIGGMKLSTRLKVSKRFSTRHEQEIKIHWRAFSKNERELLTHFVFKEAGLSPLKASRLIEILGEGRKSVRYPAPLIQKVLQFARNHLRDPQGRLALRRMVQIFSARDSASKLSEIVADSTPEDSWRYLSELRARGVSPQQIAKQINGSHHTGFLEDLRLARKVVSVLSDIKPFLMDPAKREKNKERLDEAFEAWLKDENALDSSSLARFLQADPSQKNSFLFQPLENGEIGIKILPEPEFNERIHQWGLLEDCNCLYARGRDPQQKDQLLFKGLPNHDPQNPNRRLAIYSALMNRLKGISHELEHRNHFNGNFQGVEESSFPLPLSQIKRHDRIVSETMAFLEEFRWRVQNLDQDFWDIAWRLGEPLPLYLRNIADHSYFGKQNAPLPRDFFNQN